MSTETPAQPEAHPHGLDSSGLGRRSILGLIAAGATGLALSSFSASPAFAATSPIPALPGEISRLSNQLTVRGRKPYDNVLVSINGDLARLMIPWSAVPGASTAVGVVWFYHAAGSTHSALTSAFKYPSELCVDQGAVTICQNAGGDQYTNEIAQQAQRDGWDYVSSLFRVGLNLLRANSGGGALACAAYGGGLLPRVRGLYMASAAYDMEKLNLSAPWRILPVYGFSLTAIADSNPARLDASAWSGASIRVVGAAESNPDPILPLADHGGALITKAASVAKETSSRLYTSGGHQVPSWTHKDMLASFQRWVFG